ncbi:MAG: tetratricopeptide repeat protein [Bacteroidia bacterium]
MKHIKIIAATYLFTLLSSCGNNENPQQPVKSKEAIRAELLNCVKVQEKEMHKSPELNNVTAGLAIKAYYDFISMFPDDSLSPDFIFKSAEIATATQQYPQALQDYQTIENKYPNYKLYPESLFLQASLLDNFMNDDAKAKVVYQKVIDKFPASSYANDAKAAISNMGKSDEELHKEFMKKNKEK